MAGPEASGTPPSSSPTLRQIFTRYGKVALVLHYTISALTTAGEPPCGGSFLLVLRQAPWPGAPGPSDGVPAAEVCGNAAAACFLSPSGLYFAIKNGLDPTAKLKQLGLLPDDQQPAPTGQNFAVRMRRPRLLLSRCLPAQTETDGPLPRPWLDDDRLCGAIRGPGGRWQWAQCIPSGPGIRHR